MRRLFAIAGLLALVAANSRAETPSISLLDFGATPFAQKATNKLREHLNASQAFKIADPDLARAAAKGFGYSGSLNLTVIEARDLGAALATDLYVLGDAQTLRRSSFSQPVYYESYCSIFVVSARTGRLVSWERPRFESVQAAQAEEGLFRELGSDRLIQRLLATIRAVREIEEAQRMILASHPDRKSVV